MSQPIIAGLPVLVLGVAMILLRAWMADKTDRLNRRWGRWAKWTPEQRTMRIVYLVSGVMTIGLGLLVIVDVAP
jgi:hypothetical protein